jgi:glutamine phosphoribosylpyrophosphate amidotransferase
MTCGTRDPPEEREAQAKRNFLQTTTSRRSSTLSVAVRSRPENEYFMCGIAGYSLSPDSRVERTLAAQALLAGIAERGADAVGYAFRDAEGRVDVSKLRGGASAFLDEIEVPPSASDVFLHVRDYTKGHPEIEANNHPIRHGSVVGVHNGVVENDDALLAHYGLERFDPEMTVDSEAIFALMELRVHDPRALGELHGAMAAAWMDERDAETLFLARGIGRPLWIGSTATDLFFASTRRALAIVEAALQMRLRLKELHEGRLLRVVGGRIARERRFRPDRSYKDKVLPPVRAPHEAVSCLAQLADLTAAAAYR